ncbi:hypothetical protein ElyMa_003073500 [Elysia marginata]|uniref:Peptidase A2 domain-containing protein n=1 Tax=Elysia marginata TaxID=1093978 RepID=A0AAV4IK84_9GAST|nr:hypothetical protein ElyMa_003073500 [Elysia marginata]
MFTNMPQIYTFETPQEEPGKRQGGSTVATASAGPHDPQLFITDTKSGRRFLLDTGAQVFLYHRRGMTNATGNKAHPSKQPTEHNFRLTEPAKSSDISMRLSIKHVSL